MSIADEETKARFLGDVRFQRAFMTYFSMELTRFGGHARALAISHLFGGDAPLLCGLFSGVGRPLALLADGIELRAAVPVMQALTLAAVDWMEPFCDLLCLADTDHAPSSSAPPSRSPTPHGSSAQANLTPEEILSRVGYDGRLSGVMKSGPGFHNIAHIFSNPAARAAVAEYVALLGTHRAQHSPHDCLQPSAILQHLAALSALLLGATHKPGRPAFDLYLARLPACLHGARVVLDSGWVGGGEGDEGDEAGRRNAVLLVRALWLLFLLVYITQLRPMMDGKLLVPQELVVSGAGSVGLEGGEDRDRDRDGDWEGILEEGCRRQEAAAAAGAGASAGADRGGYEDVEFLRALRSLRELEKAYGGVHGRLYLHTARKLVSQWQGWTGLGRDREVMLNIRL
jgi:hypothetical protein